MEWAEEEAALAQRFGILSERGPDEPPPLIIEEPGARAEGVDTFAERWRVHPTGSVIVTRWIRRADGELQQVVSKVVEPRGPYAIKGAVDFPNIEDVDLPRPPTRIVMPWRKVQRAITGFFTSVEDTALGAKAAMLNAARYTRKTIVDLPETSKPFFGLQLIFVGIVMIGTVISASAAGGGVHKQQQLILFATRLWKKSDVSTIARELRKHGFNVSSPSRLTVQNRGRPASAWALAVSQGKRGR